MMRVGTVTCDMMRVGTVAYEMMRVGMPHNGIHYPAAL